MIRHSKPRPITIFAGRFGSGKTEASINYSLLLARGLASRSTPNRRLIDGSPDNGDQTANRVLLVDLDTVTPYFRTREMATVMEERGVEVIAPSVIGQHLDTPAITPQILGAIEQRERFTVLDVGGDPQGARALGGFSSAIDQRGYTMLFVVNPYRPFTDTFEGLRTSLREIEASCRLAVTGLASNPNLMGQTTPEYVIEGHANVETWASELGLPIAFVCIERRWAAVLGSNHFSQPVLTLDRFFVLPWEETP
jgi:hypothetical protein